jgi:SNF2 family DNA or RNA helicase
MTGTPLSQSPLDIYAQYRFLDPSIFGTRFDDFEEEYTNSIQRDGYKVLDAKKPYKNLKRLRRKMYSCAFYVDADLALPPTQDIEVPFLVSPKTEKLYRDVKRDGCLELKQGNMVISCALSLILRLQQLTSGFMPVIDDDGEEHILQIDDARSEALKSLLEGMEHDEPVVVFAKYKKDLKNIRKVAKMLGRTYSELSGRKDTSKSWIDGRTTILGVQIQAGAESIDLTRARYCVYYTLSHSLAQYEQSRARVHRPNQTRPVVYYTLVAKLSKGLSIDEQIFAGLRLKKNVVRYIVENIE